MDFKYQLTKNDYIKTARLYIKNLRKKRENYVFLCFILGIIYLILATLLFIITILDFSKYGLGTLIYSIIIFIFSFIMFFISHLYSKKNIIHKNWVTRLPNKKLFLLSEILIDKNSIKICFGDDTVGDNNNLNIRWDFISKIYSNSDFYLLESAVDLITIIPKNQLTKKEITYMDRCIRIFYKHKCLILK